LLDRSTKRLIEVLLAKNDRDRAKRLGVRPTTITNRSIALNHTM
jgi:hypothetical protein